MKIKVSPPISSRCQEPLVIFGGIRMHQITSHIPEGSIFYACDLVSRPGARIRILREKRP